MMSSLLCCNSSSLEWTGSIVTRSSIHALHAMVCWRVSTVCVKHDTNARRVRLGSHHAVLSFLWLYRSLSTGEVSFLEHRRLSHEILHRTFWAIHHESFPDSCEQDPSEYKRLHRGIIFSRPSSVAVLCSGRVFLGDSEGLVHENSLATWVCCVADACHE